jgi:hypothetical protein
MKMLLFKTLYIKALLILKSIVQYHGEKHELETFEPRSFIFTVRFCDVKLMTSIQN